MCLVQCAGGPRPIEADSIIFEINKFLIGLQWGQDKQPLGRGAGPRLDDDTHRSISSIEDDFLTAQEHLGEDSVDDGFKNGRTRKALVVVVLYVLSLKSQIMNWTKSSSIVSVLKISFLKYIICVYILRFPIQLIF